LVAVEIASWLLMSAGLFLVVLPFFWARSVKLKTRCQRATVWIERDKLYLGLGKRRQAIDLDEVARARFAFNGNWPFLASRESKIVEDAVTLFNARGHKLMKVPQSAYGYGDLRDVLERRGIETSSVPVVAPD
jgi:hypothetical protein